MAVSCNFTFDNISEIDTPFTYSPDFKYGSTDWRIYIKKSNDLHEFKELYIEGTRNEKMLKLSEYIIEAHVKGDIRIGYSGKIPIEERLVILKNDENHNTNLHTDIMKLLNEYNKQNKAEIDCISVHIRIKIISVKGIHGYPLYNFQNPDFEDADVTLSIGTFDFYLHSQILSIHSEYFKNLIALEKEKISKKTDGDEIYQSGKKNIVLTFDRSSIDLNQVSTYFTLLYSPHKDIITKWNLKKLLVLGDCWKSQTFLNCVEEFLLDNEEFDIKQKIVWAWKYSMETLKLTILDGEDLICIYQEIKKMEEYQTISDNFKFEFTDRILDSLYFN